MIRSGSTSWGAVPGFHSTPVEAERQDDGAWDLGGQFLLIDEEPVCAQPEHVWAPLDFLCVLAGSRPLQDHCWPGLSPLRLTFR
jgi:hypothetical protein